MSMRPFVAAIDAATATTRRPILSSNGLGRKAASRRVLPAPVGRGRAQQAPLLLPTLALLPG
ncbi:MAG: hypothetical protein H7Y61_01215 [Rhizobiales bacterium]|nr:hypothetical protein [Rhizobacter sp.]